MELSQISTVRIRLLIYCVQFSPDPSNNAIDIEHVAQQVAQEDDFGSTAEYAASIREALDSETQLSLLIPQPHSEAVIRSFLSKLLDRLTTEE